MEIKEIVEKIGAEKMWELLQKLEDLGWKPYGKSIAELTETEKNVRLLTSLSSGLWQFVCENDYWVHKDTYFAEKYTDHTAIHLYQCNDYRYWLLGSALTNEDKLEDFLLNNINADE